MVAIVKFLRNVMISSLVIRGVAPETGSSSAGGEQQTISSKTGREIRGGSAFLHRALSRISASQRARLCVRIRRGNDEANAAEPLTGLQGEGGVGCHQERADDCAVGGSV